MPVYNIAPLAKVFVGIAIGLVMLIVAVLIELEDGAAGAGKARCPQQIISSDASHPRASVDGEVERVLANAFALT